MRIDDNHTKRWCNLTREQQGALDLLLGIKIDGRATFFDCLLSEPALLHRAKHYDFKRGDEEIKNSFKAFFIKMHGEVFEFVVGDNTMSSQQVADDTQRGRPLIAIRERNTENPKLLPLHQPISSDHVYNVP